MTKKELEEWLKTATFVTVSHHEYDQSSNENMHEIWQKDGKFYRLYKCNGHYSEKYGDNGFLRGFYQPEECRKEERIVKEFIWIPV